MRFDGLCALEASVGMVDARRAVVWPFELWHVFAAFRMVTADVGCAHAVGGTLEFTHRKYGGLRRRIGAGLRRHAGICAGLEPVD